MVTYTIWGDNIVPRTGLSAEQAAIEILTTDSQEFEIRPETGTGHRLWQRKQVAGKGWTKTVVFSLCLDPGEAAADIYGRVIRRCENGRWDNYTSVSTDEDFVAMQAAIQE